MTTVTTWRTDDPCPDCGTGLHAKDNGTDVRQDCPAVRLVSHLAEHDGW